MWRPPQRIKHPLPLGGWPSRDEAGRARLFAPIRIGKMTLEQRTWVPAMVPWRATEDGLVTPEVLAWYERFARGRPGGLVVEATGIRDIPSGPLLRIGHDRFLPGLQRLCDVVREASEGHTRLFIQIIDFLRIRRRPPRDRFLRQFLEITDQHREALPGLDDPAVREAMVAMPDDALFGVLTPRQREAMEFGARERVTDTHLPHIRDLPVVLPGLFADAGRRAQQAGFDGVELHYAHAYTMASMLSRLNDRTDGYGGDLQGRLRLPLEVYARVRQTVGDDYPVGCRFLADEIVAGGSGVDDAAAFGVAFARAGMDFLSLSRGGKFEDAARPKPGWAAYPYTGQSGYECMPTAHSDERGPFGRNVAAATTVRAAVRGAGYDTPVVVTGGICGFAQAEALLADDHADIVGAARQSLADPDWFRKMQLGVGDEIRRCTFTNYCEALDQKHKPVTCQLWDRLERDAPDVMLTADGRRRLVAPAWDAAQRALSKEAET